MFYATSMTMRGEPSNTDCRSLDNFIFTHMPLTKEKDYHLHKNDLISLKPRGDTAGVDNIVTKLLLEEPNWAIKVWYNYMLLKGRTLYFCPLPLHLFPHMRSDWLMIRRAFFETRSVRAMAITDGIELTIMTRPDKTGTPQCSLPVASR